jgi:hypothetical protein
MYDALAITTIVEHSIYLKQHTNTLRQHLLNFAQKSFSKNRALKLLDVVNQLCAKVLVDLELTKLEERLTKKIHCMQRDIFISVVKKAALLKIDSARQHEETTLEMMNEFFATNLNLMMKHFSKSIFEQLREQSFHQIIVAMNIVVNNTSKISFVSIFVSNLSIFSHALTLSNRA